MENTPPIKHGHARTYARTHERTHARAGSAAIYGLRGKAHVNCFIMFPEGRVSEIQERQMTTVPDENIHCVSIAGSFDDCQDIVKAAFADKPFRYCA